MRWREERWNGGSWKEMEENDWKPKEMIDKYKKINGNGKKIMGNESMNGNERKWGDMNGNER